MRSTPRRLVFVVPLLATVLGPACQCGVPATEDGGSEDAVPCILNSDCAEDQHCGDEGFCVEGLAPGTCRTDEDCEGEEVCVFPEGSDVGACINPHACDVDGDCLEGQVCEDGNGDGFRDCLYAGCESDAECEVELAGQCGVNDAPRCVARACVCRDLCGAPCGEARQCCASAGTTATCIDDPGPCGAFPCAPGFVGEASSFGDWEAPLCGYADEVCSCVELPPLDEGAIGNAQVLRASPSGALFVIAYNETYGDVVVAPVVDGVLGPQRFVDGVPPVSDDAPIVGGPSGPRGGVAAPGADVGADLDAVFADDGTLYIAAYDKTAGALRLVRGAPDGEMTASLIDGNDDVGHAVRVHITASGELVVAAVARRTDTTTSELRVYGAALPVASGAALERATIDDASLLDVDCEGGCADGEVCVAAIAPATIATCAPEGASCDCASGEVCTLQGCRVSGDEAPLSLALVADGLALTSTPAGVVVFAHDARGGALVGHRQTGGSVAAGTATFATVTVIDDGDDDVGARPAALFDGTNVLVAATNASDRALVLHTLGANLNTLSTVTLDDGERLGFAGAIDDHTVDAVALARDGSGDVVIAWQDGTLGALHARLWSAGGGLGPRQLLRGGPASTTYEGTFGLVVSAAMTGGAPAISARHLWLAHDPPIESVVVVDDLLRCPDDDPFEDNDDQASATLITAPDALRGTICGADDDDYFTVTAGADCTVSAEVLFEHDDGDLDVRLLDGGGATLDSSLSTADGESVSATLDAAGSVTVLVTGFQAAENAYVLRVDVACP